MRPVTAIAGRPNTGKTTLFNALTGRRQRVANFAGCTVEKAVGILEREEAALEIVDLPGTFSLAPETQDERVALGFLAEKALDGSDLRVLVVAEASNLKGDLPLALGLASLGYAVALVVNMIDEAAKNGLTIDRAALALETGLPVFLTCARDRRGLSELDGFLLGPRPSPAAPWRDWRFLPARELNDLQEDCRRRARKAAAKALPPPAGLLKTTSGSIALDRWVFHPVAGPALLAATLFLVFESLFAVGGPLRDAIAGALAAFSGGLRPLIRSELLASLVCDGVLAGISAVVTFIPQIAILFALIGLLEASGYLPRAGAMVDRALRPFGLDGRVFIPFLSSFACAIPGVMAARTIPSEKKRITAILLSPLMTCSARIPVYALLISAFVPSAWKPLGLSGQAVVMAGMYVLGIVAALLLALALRHTRLHEARPSPVTILPPYRWPKPRELLRYVWVRCWHFLSKAGKVIFILSLLLWALASFPRHTGGGASPAEAAREQLAGSLLGRAGRAVEPVFAPLGYDWRLSIAVISSIAAREVFVGTLGTLYALEGRGADSQGLVSALREAKAPNGSPRYTLATAVSLLLFFAIAMQCISTIAVVRRETGGWKWPALQFGTFFALAYALAWTGFRLTSWLIL